MVCYLICQIGLVEARRIYSAACDECPLGPIRDFCIGIVWQTVEGGDIFVVFTRSDRPFEFVDMPVAALDIDILPHQCDTGHLYHLNRVDERPLLLTCDGIETDDRSVGTTGFGHAEFYEGMTAGIQRIGVTS